MRWPRLGIPPLRFVDGPNGTGEGSPGVTAFPNAENVTASWDPSLAYRYVGDPASTAEPAQQHHTVLDGHG
jgi:beta-glucosidase